MSPTVFRDTQQAFENAIQQGVLSASPCDTTDAEVAIRAELRRRREVA